MIEHCVLGDDHGLSSTQKAVAESCIVSVCIGLYHTILININFDVKGARARGETNLNDNDRPDCGCGRLE